MPVSMVRLRSKSVRVRNTHPREIVVGSESPVAKPPGGGCGGKDQVS